MVHKFVTFRIFGKFAQKKARFRGLLLELWCFSLFGTVPRADGIQIEFLRVHAPRQLRH